MENEQEHPDSWGSTNDEIESFRQHLYHKNLHKKKLKAMNEPDANDE